MAAGKRIIVDDMGQRWEVYEHSPDYDHTGTPTLVFMSPTLGRRIREFPVDWDLLPVTELLELRSRR